MTMAMATDAMVQNSPTAIHLKRLMRCCGDMVFLATELEPINATKRLDQEYKAPVD
jgi:hypothetical protein